MEIKNINEALLFVDKTIDIAFFDIDNTIIANEGEANLSRWACALEKYIINSYAQKDNLMTKKELSSLVSKYIVQYIERMKPKLVEAEVVNLIRHIHSLNIPIIGLTGRPLGTEHKTFEQLKMFDIDFSGHSFEHKKIVFDSNEYPALFEYGIVTCNNNNKGVLMRQFIQKVEINPRKIMFIDDDKGFMEEVHEELQLTEIELIGLRYSYLDDKLKDFVLTGDLIPEDLR